jgi:hypothetical protein
VRPTQVRLRLDGPFAGFLLIPFEDDELRQFGTAAAMTRPRRLLRHGFGFVAPFARFANVPFTLAILFVSGLLVSAVFGVRHTPVDGIERDNGVAARCSLSGHHLPARLGRFADPERLAIHQFAVERGVLDEVTEHHVPSATGESRPFHVGGGELPGEPVVEPTHSLEGVEHFAVARRLRTATGDDVTAVGAVFARRPEELVAPRERVREFVAERRRRVAREYELDVVEFQRQVGSVRGNGDVGGVGRPEISSAGEFPAQPRGGDFLYPPSRDSSPVTT